MQKGDKLRKAKVAKKDEFYTPYNAIEEECEHYIQYFKDKKIYCNCDDWERSNFYKYFKDNFNRLGLKELVASCYVPGGRGKMCVYNGNTEIDFLLEGDGSYNSQECDAWLHAADMIVTNPPFSKERDYIDYLIDHKKEFLIMGNINLINSKPVFKHIYYKEVHCGYNFNKSYIFEIPYESKNNEGLIKKYNLDPNKTYALAPSICWYTNLPVEHGRVLKLTKKYDPEIHKTYDNYNAINCDRTKDIPYDFEGEMGVPITVFKYMNPDNTVDVEIETDIAFDRNTYEVNKILNPINSPEPYFCQTTRGATGHFEGHINGKSKYLRLILKKNLS